MDKKGQTIFGSVIIGIFIFIVGMIMFNFVDTATWTDGTDSMMNQIGCGKVDINNGTIIGQSAGLTDGQKATCLIGEMVVPYFIILVISASGGIILSRFLL